ncbi:hypothetical protein BGW80DRAFT_1168772 [Lactifluus volemus]|nr:hypothetical protein BGW80DRAFT_1168772 [Lactifluus volemus]
MHPALLLDEILRFILDNIDHDPNRSLALKSFYRLASVCRAWKDPALDYLWASLSSIDHLLALLPDNTLHGGTSPDALSRFHAYASRVRNVGQNTCSLPFLKIRPNVAAAIASGSLILPALRTVTLVLKGAPREKFPLNLCLSRTLQSVSVDVGFRSSTEILGFQEALHVYLDAVARISSSLQHLRLRGHLSDRVVSSVASMRELRSLKVCGSSQLMPRTLASIACFPKLRDLRLQLDCPNISHLADSLGSAGSNAALFSALETLRIRVSPPAAEILFAHLPAAKLRTVHLEFDLKPRSIDSWTPVLTILAERVHASLTDLTLEAITSFCEAFDDHALPPNLHFTLATLAPLARIAHLRRFTLDSSLPPDLGDADLATIASWWPEIEELSLWSRPVEAFDFPAYFTMTTTQPLRATPTSFAVLATHCPHLRQLSLPTDLAVLPSSAHPPLTVPSQTALVRLTIGCVRLGKTVDPASLAECLYRAFPALEEIEFDCGDAETSWMDVLECYFGRLGGRAVPI